MAACSPLPLIAFGMQGRKKKKKIDTTIKEGGSYVEKMRGWAEFKAGERVTIKCQCQQ